MTHFSTALKTAALAVGLLGLGAAAGCGPAYCDGYNCRGSAYYHNDRYNDSYRSDSYYYYHHRDYNGRHWVCDSDGDDCHWSYGR